jgi:zinc protease
MQLSSLPVKRPNFLGTSRPRRWRACGSIALLSCAVALPFVGSTQSAHAQTSKPREDVVPVFAFEKYTLANGLEVILHQDKRTPIVAVNLWYHVGSKDEAPGKNGFAHLFEHMMFQGSRNVGEDMFFKYLERAGASERNGTTNTDRTNYFETVPSNQLELVLWLESDRMGYLLDHVDDKTFASQRDVVKNERRQNYENAPYGLVLQFVRAALYPETHPYHRLTIGTPEDLDRATLADVRAFFQRYYVPNNATLVIAGDFASDATKALVEKYFGPLARGQDAKPLSAPVPVVLESEKRLEIEANVELPRVWLSWPTPAYLAVGDAELDLASSVLASGKSSRLYKRLVYDLQIAQDVSAHQGSLQLASTFDIVVTLRKGQKPETALGIIDEELAKLFKTGITADELERARVKQITALVFGNERITGRANMFNEYNQKGKDPGFFPRDILRYQTASAADVQQAVTRYLPLSRRVLAIVRPNVSAPRAGRLVRSTP